LTSPLLFWFRTVDGRPEAMSVYAARGTLVHKVLEDLFSLPAAERTPERARAMLAPAWETVLAEEPGLAGLFEADESGAATGFAEWWGSAGEALDRYFELEDPRRLEPAERELYVETVLDSKLLLRGYVDRLDVAPDGSVRVVDYKVAWSPSRDNEARPLFQLKFYALVIWRNRGVIPKVLQLVYLGNGEILRYEPDEDDLLATERKIDALWSAIREADERREWQPNPSRACDWCSFKDLCPAWGGTPPPVPPRVTSRGARPTPDDVRPRVLRWFGRLRRWWRRSR
jgi:putative RecB family exonuclease